MEKKIVEQIASDKIAEHLSSAWSFKFNSTKRAVGQCCYATCTIFVSRIYLEQLTEESLNDIIIHEIAHALAGHAAGHGAEWKAVCKQLGLENPASTITVIKAARGPWSAMCNKCNKPVIIGRWRRSNLSMKVHKKCHGDLRWERR